MKFNYQARNKEGQVQTGVVEASSRESALVLLQKSDLYVTFLEGIKVPFYARQIKFLSRISRKDIVMFTRQLSIMFKSNVPIVESLEGLAHQAEKTEFKEKIFKLAESVEGGATLSQALALYPEVFNQFYVSMIKSGEVSGKLPETFDYLADYLEREHGFTSQILTAMVYPAFVLIVFLIIGSLMGTMVIPQLIGILEESGTELPLITKIVISGANILNNYWWVIIILFVGLGFFIQRFLKTKEGKVFIDRASLNLPLIGGFFRKVYLSRTAMNLSTLISGGLPIARALEVTANIVGNEVYRKIILKAQEGVVAGRTISSVLSNYPKVFSPLFVQMPVVGERTGRLDSALINIVDFYQKEVERALEAFVKIFEPLLILILGFLVAGLAVALLLPLYGTIQSF